MKPNSIYEKTYKTRLNKETKNLMKSMEHYMSNQIKLELQKFDNSIKAFEVLDAQFLADIRQVYYDKVKSKILKILQETFQKNQQKIQQNFISKLYPECFDCDHTWECAPQKNKHAPANAEIIIFPDLNNKQIPIWEKEYKCKYSNNYNLNNFNCKNELFDVKIGGINIKSNNLKQLSSTIFKEINDKNLLNFDNNFVNFSLNGNDNLNRNENKFEFKVDDSVIKETIENMDNPRLGPFIDNYFNNTSVYFGQYTNGKKNGFGRLVM